MIEVCNSSAHIIWKLFLYSSLIPVTIASLMAMHALNIIKILKRGLWMNALLWLLIHGSCEMLTCNQRNKLILLVTHDRWISGHSTSGLLSIGKFGICIYNMNTVLLWFVYVRVWVCGYIVSQVMYLSIFDRFPLSTLKKIVIIISSSSIIIIIIIVIIVIIRIITGIIFTIVTVLLKKFHHEFHCHIINPMINHITYVNYYFYWFYYQFSLKQFQTGMDHWNINY